MSIVSNYNVKSFDENFCYVCFVWSIFDCVERPPCSRKTYFDSLVEPDQNTLKGGIYQRASLLVVQYFKAIVWIKNKNFVCCVLGQETERGASIWSDWTCGNS